MPPRSRPESPKRQGKGGYPNSDDQECPSSAYRALCASLRLLMELRHERGRDHFDNQENSDGQDDHLIDIAKDGDEVRDEVDGADLATTHEFLSLTLSVRRTGVTVAL